MLICAKRKEYITVRFSDPGRLRATNEDAFLADPETGLFAVADGMGGHAAGEVASHPRDRGAARGRLAPGCGARIGRTPDPASIARKWLASLVEAANRVVFEAARANPEYRGMGTTLTALYLRSPVACYAHVGDSRLYRFRDGRFASSSPAITPGSGNRLTRACSRQPKPRGTRTAAYSHAPSERTKVSRWTRPKWTFRPATCFCSARMD